MRSSPDSGHRRGATDAAPWHRHAAATVRQSAGRRRSLYVTMRDGVRLAVDVHLPEEHRSGDTRPAILHQTRYFRSVRLREPAARLPLEWMLNNAATTRDRFVGAGYAWVAVCARGSGASFGVRPCPWSPDEVADGKELLDWVVAQPWCNGNVGATGLSYSGTAAELLLVHHHPALKAVAPRFSVFDVFSEVAFPGGIHLAWFTEAWSTFNRRLDAGALDEAFALVIGEQVRALRATQPGALVSALLKHADGPVAQRLTRQLMRWVASGVRPVDGADGGTALLQAMAEHAGNADVHALASRLRYRDDSHISDVYPEATVDTFSPHGYVEALQQSEAAVLGYSGWMDGAYCRSATHRYRRVRTPGRRLLLGPWDHGGTQNVSPRCDARATAFDQSGELLRFFDRHLRGAASDEPAPVRYFTVGEERWKQADDWPPPGGRTERLYLGADRRLVPSAPADASAVDVYRIDHGVGTGQRSRFNSLLGLLPPVGYGDRRSLTERLLVYRTAPLPEALEVTGEVRVTLHVSADHHDAHLFVYLEDEHPDGRVDGVTEGWLRAVHRHLGGAATDPLYLRRSFSRADARPLVPGQSAELVLELLPISWRFARGHRLRLAIAGADRDHFEVLTDASELAVHRSATQASFLDLPVR